MQKIKKSVSILLSLIMVLGLFTIVPFSAGAATVSGTEGNITWSFDSETGTLTIGGTGDMNSYGSDREIQKSSNTWIYITNAPWGEYYGNINRIVIEEGVTSIGDNAFSGLCRDVSASVKVQLPSTLTRIGNRAFIYCNKINEINLPNGLISIGEKAFSDCGGLQSVVFPDSLKSIGNFAFSTAGCGPITIPESVEVIGDYAFEYARTQKITFLGTPELGAGIFCDKAQPCVFIFKKRMQFNYLDRSALPEDAWVLREEDFVFIPDGCTYVKNGEVIPITPENTGEVFGDATVPFPEPEDENISWSFNNETGVLTISGTGDMMDYHKNGAFPVSDTQMAVVTSAPWGAFCKDIKSVVIEEGVTSVGNYAFYNIGTESTGSMMSNVQLPSTVKRIGKFAFFCCEQLTDINLPDGLEAIEEAAFCECGQLTGINLPESLKSLEKDAFNSCDSLSRVNVPDGIKAIENYTFAYCKKLSEVRLSDNLESIGQNAFSSCDALESITLPPQLKTIGESAFIHSGLKEITIPESVVNIGAAAFQQIENLKKATVLGTPNFDGNTVFYRPAPGFTLTFKKAMKFKREQFSGPFYFMVKDVTVFVPYGCTYNDALLTDGNAGEMFYEANIVFTQPVAGHSISLNGDIAMNYYLAVPENTALHFEWYNKTFDHTLTADDFDTASGYYKVTVNVAAAEMSCPITMTCKVWDKYPETDVFSVRDYMDTILDSESGFSKDYISKNGEKKYGLLVDLVKKTLDYGAKAQTRFGVTDVALANTGVDYTMKPVTTYHIEPQKSDMTADLHKYGIDYIGTSIVFLSATTLRHYYVISDNKLFEKVKDTANFDFVDKGARICFELKNIPAAQLDVAKAFTLGDSVYRYSVLDYCKLVIADESKSQADRELAMATYWYNDAAKTYFYAADEYEDDMV